MDAHINMLFDFVQGLNLRLQMIQLGFDLGLRVWHCLHRQVSSPALPYFACIDASALCLKPTHNMHCPASMDGLIRKYGDCSRKGAPNTAAPLFRMLRGTGTMRFFDKYLKGVLQWLLHMPQVDFASSAAESTAKVQFGQKLGHV